MVFKIYKNTENGIIYTVYEDNQYNPINLSKIGINIEKEEHFKMIIKNDDDSIRYVKYFEFGILIRKL